MTTRFFSVFALMLTGSIAIAAPTVDGLTISWPDDGWYQVQKVSNNTITEVCQGGRSCDVSPGQYNVINLSTQQRFDGIIVEAGGAATSTVVVTGNTISWPDNGWYQVLDEHTYSEVCGGTRSCVVAPGSYSVINHSAGVRYDGIVVEQGTKPENPVVVTGSTISWPNDGWYQVQSSSTYESVCEGGTSCSVPAGSYSVINHATGTRWADIIVDGPSAMTTVDFDITVPAYNSNELKIEVALGSVVANAGWVVDESWSTSVDVPTLTAQPLVVTFYDNNGAIVLGRYQQDFTTGSSGYEVKTITASQFDTPSWDDDNDGKSNLAELIAGTNPLMPESFSDFSLLDVSNDVLQLAGGVNFSDINNIIADAAYAIRQTTTITWPSDDWYQAQIVSNYGSTPDVYNTVCDGGSECKLMPGRHAIINHTTGERTYQVIPTLSRDEQPNATLLPNTTYTSTDPDPYYWNGTKDVQSTLYACENGGSMQYDLILEPDQHRVNLYRYRFDQCAMTARSALLPDGDYVLDGQYEHVSIWHRSSDAGVERSYHYNYDELTIIGASGLEYHIQARVRNAGGYYWPYSRTTNITDYRKILPGGQLAESVTDTQYEYTRGYYKAYPPYYRHKEAYTLNVSGTVSSDKTANQRVTINTGSMLNYKWDGDDEVEIPFNGNLEMLAEDGSFLFLNANPALVRDDRGRFAHRVDLDYTAKNGEQELKPGEEIYRYRYGGNRCTQNRRPACKF